MLLEEPGGGGAALAPPFAPPSLATEQYTTACADWPRAVDQPASQAHPQELSAEPCTPQAGCTRQLLAGVLLGPCRRAPGLDFVPGQCGREGSGRGPRQAGCTRQLLAEASLGPCTVAPGSGHEKDGRGTGGVAWEGLRCTQLARWAVVYGGIRRVQGDHHAMVS